MARPLRSMLYVPGDKPRALAGARTLGADAVILDLEDAVAPEHKAQARANVHAALQQPWPCPVLVRINAEGTPWAQDDRDLLLTLVRAGHVGGVVLPKVEDPRAVGGARLGVPLWTMIETPLGVLNAAAIAALPEVAGLIAGANDLTRALRAQPHVDRLPLLHALSAVVLAARAAGKTPMDAAYNDVRDPQGLTRECAQGRVLGFTGKTLIHPGQIGPAHEAFGVTAAQAHAARALLETWHAARGEGRSVATFGGALVEQMHADEAQEVLDLWEATQLGAAAGAARSGASG